MVQDLLCGSPKQADGEISLTSLLADDIVSNDDCSSMPRLPTSGELTYALTSLEDSTAQGILTDQGAPQ